MPIKPILSILIILSGVNTYSQNETEELKALIKSKDYTKAYFRANKILEKDSNNAKAYFYKAEALYGVGEIKLADQFYSKSIKLDPSFYGAYLRRAEQTYNFMNKYEKYLSKDILFVLSIETLTNLNKVIELNYEDDDVMRMLSELKKYLKTFLIKPE